MITGEPAVYGIDRTSGRIIDRDVVPSYPLSGRNAVARTPAAGTTRGEGEQRTTAETAACNPLAPVHIIPGKGDVVTITLDSVFLKRARVAVSPHVLVYAEVYPDGGDDPKKAYTRVVFEQRNQPANVFLGFADPVLYGPAVYQGFPIRVKLYVVDLVREHKEDGSKVLDKLGGFAKYAPVQASLPISLALDIAKTLNALREDDYELRVDLTLHSQDAVGVFSFDKERDSAMQSELSRIGKPYTLNTGLRTGSYFINKRELPDRSGTTPFQSISYDWANPNQEALYLGADGNQYLVEGFFSIQGGRNYFIADHAYRMVLTPPEALAEDELDKAARKHRKKTAELAAAKSGTPAEDTAEEEERAAAGEVLYWKRALNRARIAGGKPAASAPIDEDVSFAMLSPDLPPPEKNAPAEPSSVPMTTSAPAPVVVIEVEPQGPVDRPAMVMRPMPGVQPAVRRPIPFQPASTGPGWSLQPDRTPEGDAIGDPGSSVVIRYTEKGHPNHGQEQTLRRGTRIEVRDQTYALMSVEVGARGGTSLSTDALRADSDLAVARIKDLLDSTGASGQEINKSLDAVASTAATIFEQRRLALEIGTRVANDSAVRNTSDYIILWTNALEKLEGNKDTTAYRNLVAKDAAIISVLAGNIVNFPVVPSDKAPVIEVLRGLKVSDLNPVEGRPGRFKLTDDALNRIRSAMGLS